MQQINFYKVLWLLAGVMVFNIAFCRPRENPGEIKKVTIEQQYMYRPANGGIEILNGDGRFNRPLYTSVECPFRLVALAGDRTDFMLMELGGKGALFKLANLKLGFSGETWLSEVEPVTARYELGTQKYQIGEGGNTVFLDAVRAQEFDGLLSRMRRSGVDGTPLVFALGGRSSGSDFGAQGFSNIKLWFFNLYIM